MLMQSMRRNVALLIVVIAAAIALEPVLHTHPLISHGSPDIHSLSASTSLPCAVCTTSTDRVTLAPQVTEAPLAAESDVAEGALSRVALPDRSSLASRAPPAA